jgi:hypothetical protein
MRISEEDCFMGGLVINCKKCNKIFQQRLHPICPECVKLEESQLQSMYRILQESASSGGVAIDTLSEMVGMPQEDIEKHYLEGHLSTAGIFLQMPCQACGGMFGEKDRRGRYCVKCSEITANKAGVEVRPLQEIRKEEEEVQRREKQESVLKPSPVKPQGAERDYRFGSFIRR